VKTISIAAAALLPWQALAHEVDGPGDAHWHATDAVGFAALALVIGLAVWANRRK
jgi:hypothetical protein